MNTENCDFIIKCIFVGNSGVGKTSLINRYIKNKLPENIYSTLGVDYYSSAVKSNNKLFKFQIWDLAGQENFRNIVKSFYRNSAIVFFVFDLTSIDTLNSLEDWITSINSNNNDYLLVLIGNKNDLHSNIYRIPMDIIEDVLDKYNCLYFETSAITNEVIEISNKKQRKSIVSLRINDIFSRTLEKLLEYNPDIIQDLYKSLNNENYIVGKLYNGVSINRNKVAQKKCCW